MKRIGVFFFLLAVLGAALAAVGCAKKPGGQTNPGSAESGVIKIATALPMTGNNAEYGQSFVTAAQLMVDNWNAAGGVLGKKIEVVVFDDKNLPEEAANIAQKIVSDKDIIGVLGHFSSGVSMTAAPTYQESQVIEISNCASHPDYSKIGNYIFRNNTVINVEFAVVIDMIANDLNLTKVGIIAIKTDWGNTAGHIAEQMVKDNPKLSLVAYEEVLETSDDHGPAIAKLKAAGTEAVLAVGMYSLYGPLARQYKEADPKIQLCGAASAYSYQIIELGGSAVEGLVAPVSFFDDSDDPATRAFVAEFTQRFKKGPTALTAQAYDSIGILLQAIKNAGTQDRAKVRDAVNAINYPGVTGPTAFDALGDASKTFQKVIIKNGKFVQYKK
jgi:branched-chain amino acid transport system substrate-binding protein